MFYIQHYLACKILICLIAMKLKTVTHVLFDLDGLLLDTENIYNQVYGVIATEYGKEYDFDLKMKVMGTTAFDSAHLIVKELQLPITPDEFLNKLTNLVEIILPNSQLLPGAEKLIRHFHKKGIPMGLATSSDNESYHLKIDKLHQELFSLFNHKTLGGSDPAVKRGKPNPDIFLVAASKFSDNPNPEQCLVFEDAVNGVKAARAAGMQVVMVPASDIDKSLTKDATLVLSSLEEFKPELFGLPFYDE